MPLIQIHLVKGKSAKYVQSIMDGVHEALRTAWEIPANDRFQIVTEHKKEHFHFDKTIWGVKRSNNVIAIYITSIKRTKAMKVKLYKELANALHKKAKVRKEDVFVTLVQVQREDWSFGNGIAQLSK
jgi:phenylpyruvate tautomerase PptA (4-oxalocrotonate tautomerase family)